MQEINRITYRTRAVCVCVHISPLPHKHTYRNTHKDKHHSLIFTKAPPFGYFDWIQQFSSIIYKSKIDVKLDLQYQVFNLPANHKETLSHWLPLLHLEFVSIFYESPAPTLRGNASTQTISESLQYLCVTH